MRPHIVRALKAALNAATDWKSPGGYTHEQALELAVAASAALLEVSVQPTDYGPGYVNDLRERMQATAKLLCDLKQQFARINRDLARSQIEQNDRLIRSIVGGAEQ